MDKAQGINSVHCQLLTSIINQKEENKPGNAFEGEKQKPSKANAF
jgi:hypothetical protein